MKKIVALVMALAMIAGLAVAVFAEDDVTAPADGLVAHLTFDDAASLSTADVVAKPSDVNGDVEATITDDAKIGSGAYQFGNQTFLSLTKADGSSLLTGANSITVSYWAKHSASGTQWTFFATANDENGKPMAPAGGAEKYVGILENSGIHTELYNCALTGGARTYHPDAMSALIANEWHHVVLVIDTDNADPEQRMVKVYADGWTPDNSGVITHEGHTVADILGEDHSVLLGYAPWAAGEFADGVIDDLYIYNRALSEEEVGQLMAAQSVPEIRFSEYKNVTERPKTTAGEPDETKAPAGETNAPAGGTEKPAGTGAATEAPKDEGGCGSTLGAAAAIVALTAVFGCAVVKKH